MRRQNKERLLDMEEFTVRMDVPMEHMQNLFGKCDSYIRKIEEILALLS